MNLTDHTALKIVGLILLFGPVPVAFLAWGRDKVYVVYILMIAYVLAYIFLVFLGIWVLIFFLPAAWYIALKPVIDKITY